MMNRLLILLLMVIGLNIPVAQAQHATRDMRDRDAVQYKTTPVKAYQWGSRFTAAKSEVLQDLLWDFETDEDVEAWNALDLDGDGYNWTVFGGSGLTHSGEMCMASESYINDYGALHPDNLLISPQVPLSGTLTIWAASYSSDYLERFAVYVCVGEPTAGLDNLVKISPDYEAPYQWTDYTFNLDEFSGETGCIIIRHYNIMDMWKLLIDDVSITYNQTPAPTITYEDTGEAFLITATGEGQVCLYCEDVLVAEGEGYATYIIPYGEYEEEYGICATAQATGMKVSDYALMTVYVPALPMIALPPPYVYCELTEDALVVTATGEGTVTLYIQYIDNETGEMTTVPYSDEGTVTVEVPRTEEYCFINYWAVAEMDGYEPGMSNPEYYVEVPAKEMEPITDAPEISFVMCNNGVMVTATGEGHVCLYMFDMLVAEGEGYVEYFIPCGEEEEEYCFSATAQGIGKEVSVMIYMTVYVPALPLIVLPDPYVYCELTEDALVVTATGEGTVTLYIQYIDNETGEMTTISYSDESMVTVEVPRTEEDCYINYWAVAEMDGYEPGMSNPEYYVEVPAKPQYVLGDVDGDGTVTISDVTAIIDYILAGDTSVANHPGADVNDDGIITISDVTALIDYLLKGTW